MRVKAPAEFGFELGALLSVSDDRCLVSEVSDRAKSIVDCVYVAWLPRDSQALKVSLTSGTLWQRWSGIVRVMNADPLRVKLRPNEWQDRERLFKATGQQQIAVWFKEAEQISVAYAAAEGFPTVSLAAAEERFLDWYYCPAFGKALGARRAG